MIKKLYKKLDEYNDEIFLDKQYIENIKSQEVLKKELDHINSILVEEDKRINNISLLILTSLIIFIWTIAKNFVTISQIINEKVIVKTTTGLLDIMAILIVFVLFFVFAYFFSKYKDRKRLLSLKKCIILKITPHDE